MLQAISGYAEVEPKVLWEDWQQNAPLSKRHLSHRAWQQFIDTYVTNPVEGLSRVDYQGVTHSDKLHLKEYLVELSKVKITELNRREQLAFWLNLYNAITVNLILDHYPVRSIEEINISPGLFTTGPWEANQITIEGENLSLYDIRNRIIRPIWNDPRALYALHNGTIGSPNIFREAFDGRQLEAQLNQVASDFINCRRAVNVIKKKLILSKLFEWYEEDFGNEDRHVIKHLFQYANTPLQRQLKNMTTIDDYTYNWHLDKINIPQ